MSKWERIQYHIPPECQGQIVEVSYGCDEDYVYRKTFDRSDRTTTYSRFEPFYDDDFQPWNREPSYGEEVPFTKDEVQSWETASSYVSLFPSDDGEGACDVEVQIGEVAGHWFLRTQDDAGGSDECDDTSYSSKSEAEAAAEDFADEHHEADDEDENAAEYLKRQLEETAGEPDPEGEYCVYWDTSGDDEGPGKRYASPEAATAAAELANQGLHKHNPGGNLLCGYEPRRLVNGKWIGLDEEPEE
jgi:hypothetical protein